MQLEPAFVLINAVNYPGQTSRYLSKKIFMAKRPCEVQAVYNTTETFDALDWLAFLTTHIPNRGEQMVRYYGYYSNKSRGMRKKEGKDDAVPSLIECDVSSSAFRKNWGRLIQKIYNVGPLVCPKCQGRMRVISFIEAPDVIKKILKHLGLWLVKPKVPPRANAPPSEGYIDYSDSQIAPSGEHLYINSDYSIDTYLS